MGKLLCFLGKHKWACTCGTSVQFSGWDTHCIRCLKVSEEQSAPIERIVTKGSILRPISGVHFHYCHIFLSRHFKKNKKLYDRIFAEARGRKK